MWSRTGLQVFLRACCYSFPCAPLPSGTPLHRIRICCARSLNELPSAGQFCLQDQSPRATFRIRTSSRGLQGCPQTEDGEGARPPLLLSDVSLWCFPASSFLLVFVAWNSYTNSAMLVSKTCGTTCRSRHPWFEIWKKLPVTIRPNQASCSVLRLRQK